MTLSCKLATGANFAQQRQHITCCIDGGLVNLNRRRITLHNTHACRVYPTCSSHPRYAQWLASPLAISPANTTNQQASPKDTAASAPPTTAIHSQGLSVGGVLDSLGIKDVQCHKPAVRLGPLPHHVLLHLVCSERPVPDTQHCQVTVEAVGRAEATSRAVLILQQECTGSAATSSNCWLILA